MTSITSTQAMQVFLQQLADDEFSQRFGCRQLPVSMHTEAVKAMDGDSPRAQVNFLLTKMQVRRRIKKGSVNRLGKSLRAIARVLCKRAKAFSARFGSKPIAVSVLPIFDTAQIRGGNDGIQIVLKFTFWPAIGGNDGIQIVLKFTFWPAMTPVPKLTYW